MVDEGVQAGQQAGASATPIMSGGYLIREARLRAGLTQAILAQRLGTSQSLVARWENETVSPLFETVVRAVRACGLDLGVGIYGYDHEHDALIEDQLRLSPDARARWAAEIGSKITDLVARAKRVQ